MWVSDLESLAKKSKILGRLENDKCQLYGGRTFNQRSFGVSPTDDTTNAGASGDLRGVWDRDPTPRGL